MVTGLVILIIGISLTMAVIAGSILIVDRNQQTRRDFVTIRVHKAK